MSAITNSRKSKTRYQNYSGLGAKSQILSSVEKLGYYFQSETCLGALETYVLLMGGERIHLPGKSQVAIGFLTNTGTDPQGVKWLLEGGSYSPL